MKILHYFIATFLALAFLPAIPAPESAPSLQVPSTKGLKTGQVFLPHSRWPLSPDYSNCGGVNVDPLNAAYEQDLVELVNQSRLAHNLPPLKRVSLLDLAARYHAADMRQDDYFEHDTYDRLDGQLKWICAWSTRVLSYYDPDQQGWSYLAENIVAGTATPQDAFDAWMNSAGHRANILSPDSWETGLGFDQGGTSWHFYWVQDFGRRAGVFPLVINNEAASTVSPSVSLYVYGDWQEMRLRNEQDAWTPWLPFQSKLDWNLDPAAGQRTVWVELRKPGETATSSDTIYLDLSGAVPRLGNLPDRLGFLYSLADSQMLPASVQLTPLNPATSDPLTWALSSQGAWFTVSPAIGKTPGLLTVLPLPQPPGLYTGTLTISVVDPPGAEGSPHQVQLSLRVIQSGFYHRYLPQIHR